MIIHYFVPLFSLPSLSISSPLFLFIFDILFFLFKCQSDTNMDSNINIVYRIIFYLYVALKIYIYFTAFTRFYAYLPINIFHIVFWFLSLHHYEYFSYCLLISILTYLGIFFTLSFDVQLASQSLIAFISSSFFTSLFH